jgi:hypothetical protein
MTQTISLPVNADIQNLFEKATESERQALGEIVSVFLKEGWAEKNLIEVMQEIGDRAEKRGLTPEILEESLNEEVQSLSGKIQGFKEKYQLSSEQFYQQFMAGELGDSIDFMEWSVFCELLEVAQLRLEAL